MTTKKWSVVLVTLGIFAALILLTAFLPAGASKQVEGASMNGAQFKASKAGVYSTGFMVRTKQANELVGIDFRATMLAGGVTLELVDSGDRPVWQQQVMPGGSFAISKTVTVPEPGEYQWRLAHDGAVQITNYSLMWKPGEITSPAISPLALAGGLGMLLVALVGVAYAVWRRLGLKYLAIGAVAWAVSVALKFAWAIPVNSPVYQGLGDALPTWLANPIFEMYVGSLTGLFEVILVWLVLRRTSFGRSATPSQALAFGIGFGAVEALLLGGSNLLSVASALVAPQLFPVDTLQQIAQLNSPLFALAPISERIFTLLVHVCSNMLIFYAIATRKAGWAWLAFTYKSLLDAVAAFAQVQGVDSPAMLWGVEVFVAVWGVAGLFGTRWLLAHWPSREPVLPVPLELPPVERGTPVPVGR